VWLLNETDREGKPLVTQDGKPKKQCYFALAIDKQNPEWGAFFAKLAQVAQAGYPQFFNPQGQCVKPDFAWKVADGDGIDADGKPNNAKPGWAGCWVVRFSSSFLPRCFEKGKYAPTQQLQDERAIKTGFFVRVGGLMSANIGSKKPGLYLNADLVELNFVGEEILPANIRDASAALGAQQSTYVPQGAMPVGSPGAAMGGMGGAAMGGMGGAAMGGMGGAAMGGMSANVGSPGAAMGGMGGAAMGGMGGVQPGMAAQPGSMVQPNQGFVAGAMQAAGVGGAAMGGFPQPGGMGGFPQPGGAAQQPQYQMTPKAGAYTFDQFLQNGFSVEQILSDGYAVRVA
jgi:hypothetical protein